MLYKALKIPLIRPRKSLYNLIVHEAGTCLSYMTIMNELGIISMYASAESII